MTEEQAGRIIELLEAIVSNTSEIGDIEISLKELDRKADKMNEKLKSIEGYVDRIAAKM